MNEEGLARTYLISLAHCLAARPEESVRTGADVRRKVVSIFNVAPTELKHFRFLLLFLLNSYGVKSEINMLFNSRGVKGEDNISVFDFTVGDSS